jgi:hypothetical protein
LPGVWLFIAAENVTAFAVLGLPLGEGDQRQRPQVDLGRELEVELVVHQPEVRPQRQLSVHPNGGQRTGRRTRASGAQLGMGHGLIVARQAHGCFTPAG